MRIKQIPEDFSVIEHAKAELDPAGTFSIYKLSKHNASTFEVAEQIISRLNLLYKDISYCGVKDRMAVSEQLFAINNGPQEDVIGKSYSLKFMGRSQNPCLPSNIESNTFTIVVRAMEKDEADALIANARAHEGKGVPNYLDEQRFGSVRQTNQFIYKELLSGRNENALRLVIAEPSRHDRTFRRKIKQSIADHWGDWKAALKAIPFQCFERTVIGHMIENHGDFRGAMMRHYRAMLRMELMPYPSMLWNRILFSAIEEEFGPFYKMPYSQGEMAFPESPVAGTEENLTLSLPMPAKGAEYPEWLRESAERVMRREGLTFEGMEIEGMPKLSAKPVQRKAFFFPRDIKVEGPTEDDLNPGTLKLTLSFGLQSGSYATLAVKRFLGKHAVKLES